MSKKRDRKRVKKRKTEFICIKNENLLLKIAEEGLKNVYKQSEENLPFPGVYQQLEKQLSRIKQYLGGKKNGRKQNRYKRTLRTRKRKIKNENY